MLAIGQMSQISLIDEFDQKRSKKVKSDQKYILDEKKKSNLWLQNQPKYVLKEVKKLDKYLKKVFSQNAGLFTTIAGRLQINMDPNVNLGYAVDQRMVTILTYKEMIKNYDSNVKGLQLDTKNWAFEALDLIGADVYDRETYKDIDAYIRKDAQSMVRDYRQNKLPKVH